MKTSNYDKWAWETDKGSTEINTEKIGEFTLSSPGTCEIVLDELDIEEAEYADKHEIYVWKPKVNI